MILRQNQDCRPQIVFTSDFHELLQGDLVPGTCQVRYDPLRLVPRDELHDENHHIKAHARFHPVGGSWAGEMISPANAPLEKLEDPAGQGFMLSTSFEIPPGCDELEMWFSCTHADGSVHWDSELGKNYWLRFSIDDLEIKQARIVVAKKKTAAQDALQVELTSISRVERVTLRWRAANLPGYPRTETSLACTSIQAGRKLWSAPAEGLGVPKGATVVFDLVYYVDGRKFTDDNQGRWYAADMTG